MKSLFSLEDLSSDENGAVVALGNFDGVHKGHQALIAEAKAKADELSAPLLVMTFEPHPRQFFSAQAPAVRLATLAQKEQSLVGCSVDVMLAVPFDREFAAMQAEDFINDLLIGQLGAKHIFAGWDFRFGSGRAGSMAMIEDLAGKAGVGVTTVQPVKDSHGEPFSSSRVRACLAAGELHAAAELLGRDWEIAGKVMPGDQIGRTIGFPTANLALGDYQRAKYGIYAVESEICGREGTWFGGAAYLGYRPTVNGAREVFEVHFFDFDEDIYGEEIKVRLIDYIRDDAKLDSLDALKKQIEEDCIAARAVLSQRQSN